jgi:glucose/arabinose dehydrogenase
LPVGTANRRLQVRSLRREKFRAFGRRTARRETGPRSVRITLATFSMLMGALSHVAFAVTKGRDAGALYAELCANCHGPQLEGGKGGGLRGNPWKHGGDDASIARSIRDGFPNTGMPAFKATVNEAETQALVVFLREAAARVVETPPATEKPPPRETQRSQEHRFKVESVAEGLDVPWSMSFLPDGRLLVAERIGRLRMVEHGAVRSEAIGGLPPVVVKQEAGLMSVVAHPDFAHNPWIYLSFCDPGPGDSAMTKIIRARLRDWQLVDHETIFAVSHEHYQKTYVLFGGRMVFDGDYLFFSVGVRGLEEKVTQDAQELTRANGKIHRVFHDGKIPPDNPFVGMAGAVGSIWAYGVRNPQGLARDPRDGALWETEHGPRGGDELNRIERGGNYGWPIVTRGMNYDGTPISEKKDDPKMISPVVDWTPSLAVSQIEFYSGDKFPQWKHQLFVGSLVTQKLQRLVVDAGRVTHTEEVFKNLGRVRDIKTSPDGLIYVALEAIGKPGRIIRLVPAE